ncbi:MAG: tyrosinase family protein [Acidobacteria bacterium]|nr:tyrosinase family protein [Acidobacteriota bacterium]
MTFKDPIIEFYAKAILEMQKLDLNNPLSWRYQSAIHDYPALPARGSGGKEADDAFARRRDIDPNAVQHEAVPSTADQDKFWRQCQHTSWFFLSWHRMYLHHFEKIIISHVTKLKGPADWALPYWNYALSDADGHLPEPFRLDKMPDGTPNPLFITQRSPNANAGTDFADATRRDAALNSLNESSFEPVGASRGFGGPKARNHPITGPGGTVEVSPHNGMHGSIAGPSRPDPAFPSSPARSSRPGFMNSPVTAPLDPIFWLHHCNIDRLWRAWQRKGNTETKDSAWTGEVFSFHDSTGAAIDMKSPEVIDTKPAPLAYIYDDEPTP